tara:strand:- start:204 stop:917 length:714 start_codon:yes stop_codon:yes gene_type:complete
MRKYQLTSFIFDVDGTLTPSRGKIDREFEVWFKNFAAHNEVYFVTGSDKDKTQEQLGESIYEAAVRVYQCAGNDVWEGSKNVRRTETDWGIHVNKFLRNALNNSSFELRTGLHIETRPGLLNFSVVGRKATIEQRQEYVQHDSKTLERFAIAAEFNKRFPRYQASVAGETGIDIVERGNTKAQIIPDFSSNTPLYFFGDKCDVGGNDHEIAMAVESLGGTVYHVDNWRTTWKVLKEL